MRMRGCDPRPLAFFRISFGFLMMVYSASKCSDGLDSSLAQSDHRLLSIKYRVPEPIYNLASNFPWYTSSHSTTYWLFHPSLMLLSAAGIATGCGTFSRVSCIAFGMLKLMQMLHTQWNFNNHEYMYGTLALVFGLIGGHDASLSYVGAIVKEGLEPQPARQSATVGAGACLCVACIGCMYMMLQNAVYGIPGEIAVIGMVICVWPATLLLLARTTDAQVSPLSILDHTVLQLYCGAVYFYAGLAKLGPDWLSGRTFEQLVGVGSGLNTAWTGPTAPTQLLRMLTLDTDTGAAAIHLISYSGAALDVLVIVMLNCRSKHIRMFFASSLVAFHLINHFVFRIETFPWVMLSSLGIHFTSELWVEEIPQKAQQQQQGKLQAEKHVSNDTIEVKESQAHKILPAEHHTGSNMFIVSQLNWFVLQASHLLRWPIQLLRRALALSGTLLLCAVMAFHLLQPLPCGVHTALQGAATLGDEPLNWGSQCTLFCWRMMTRSSETLGVGFSMKHADPSKPGNPWIRYQTQQLSPEMQARWASAARQEDVLGLMLADAARNSPVSRISSMYVDSWIQVNGPPYQRYINPNTNLVPLLPGALRADGQGVAQTEDHLRMMSWTAWINNWWHSLLHGPKPLTTWVIPRDPDLRGTEWAARYRELNTQVKQVALN